jgi:hypothetical protein
MSLYKPGLELDGPPSQQKMAALNQLIEEMTKAGVLLATDGLLASSKGARVRLSDGKFIVTDGPFAETKELIAGYAILNAASKPEAIEWTRRFLKVMGEGECEVRQMFGPGSEACPEKAESSHDVTLAST